MMLTCQNMSIYLFDFISYAEENECLQLLAAKYFWFRKSLQGDTNYLSQTILFPTLAIFCLFFFFLHLFIYWWCVHPFPIFQFSHLLSASFALFVCPFHCTLLYQLINPFIQIFIEHFFHAGHHDQCCAQNGKLQSLSTQYREERDMYTNGSDTKEMIHILSLCDNNRHLSLSTCCVSSLAISSHVICPWNSEQTGWVQHGDAGSGTSAKVSEFETVPPALGLALTSTQVVCLFLSVQEMLGDSLSLGL